jgi:flagellar biosynthetic protein FliR
LFVSGFDAFILVFVRMTGLFVIAPIFGRGNVPPYFKIGFSLFTSLILINTVAVTAPDYGSIYGYALLIMKEFLVGLTIGFVAYLAFTAIYIAGEIIDMQIGFGIVNVLDPVNNIQVPITSNLYFIISMLVFIAMNGHHVLIKALFDSYTTVPLGTAVFNPAFENSLINIFANVFFIGFKIAAPVVAAVLITNITLGTISRMVPQISVFVIGMPLTIFIGIVIMMVTIPMFIYVLDSLFKLMDNSVQEFIKGLTPK